MRDALGDATWPVTWVEGESCNGAKLAGVQIFAARGRNLQRIRLGHRVVGTVFEDGNARHCVLGGLAPTSVALHRPAQVQQLLGNLECVLDLAGFEMADVMRTWFYNDDILSWYGEFNRVRTALYSGVKWRTGATPASTGVSGRNPDGAALAVAAWAVRPLDATASVREIISPLQCPAPNYGSSFSRAVEVQSGGLRRLFVSGTASIYSGGETAHVGNIRKQVELTMEVIVALLQAREMSWSDVTRATAYFKNPGYQAYFAEWCAVRQATLPVVNVNCDICRDDLLWELELDACVVAR